MHKLHSRSWPLRAAIALQLIPALAVADDELAEAEVDVLDAEAEDLEEAQAGAVEEGGGDLLRAVEPREDLVDLLAREDGRNAARLLGADEAGRAPCRPDSRGSSPPGESCPEPGAP